MDDGRWTRCARTRDERAENAEGRWKIATLGRGTKAQEDQKLRS